MSDLNTMKFIDHAAPASVSIETVNVEAKSEGMSDEILAKIGEIAQAIKDRPDPAEQIIPAPAVIVRPKIFVEPPKIEFPEIKIPSPLAPQVFVTVKLLDTRAQVILALFLVTQIIMLGVLLWK